MDDKYKSKSQWCLVSIHQSEICCIVLSLLIWSKSAFMASCQRQTWWWWQGWESGTYPVHSEMSRIFYLPQHRKPSMRYPVALRCMRSTGHWVSTDERQHWKFLVSPPRGLNPTFGTAGWCFTTRPLSSLSYKGTMVIKQMALAARMKLPLNMVTPSELNLEGTFQILIFYIFICLQS